MSITTYQTKIGVADLVTDPRVQRVEGVNEKRVAQMASKFNPRALGTITLWHRDDNSLAIIDGAHRSATAKSVGYTAKILATVHTGLTVEQAAELFLLLNEFKSPSAISRFLVRTVMREKTAVQINEVVEAHGWRIRGGAGTGSVGAVTALERVYRNGAGSMPVGENRHLLDQVLEVLTAAWEHEPAAASEHHLLAVAQLYGRFGAGIDTKKLVTEMSHTRPDVLLGRAKSLRDIQGGTVGSAMAKILAGLHNKGRRSNLLPEWVWIR